MKKTAILIVILAFVILLPASDGRFFVSAGAGLLVPKDSGFKDFYGQALVGPDLRAGLRLYRGFHALIGVSFFTAKGTIPVLGDEASASQFFLPLGIGWETRSGSLGVEFHGGLLLAGFREKALGVTASKMAPGFDVGGGLRYFLKRSVFLELAFGYAGAATSVQTEAGEKDIELGGLGLGVRLGFRL